MRLHPPPPVGLHWMLANASAAVAAVVVDPVSLSVSRMLVARYGKVLEEGDLEPVMAKMREQLMSRNVASEVASDITASVKATLLNQKLKSFTRYACVNSCFSHGPYASCRYCYKDRPKLFLCVAFSQHAKSHERSGLTSRRRPLLRISRRYEHSAELTSFQGVSSQFQRL